MRRTEAMIAASIGAVAVIAMSYLLHPAQFGRDIFVRISSVAFGYAICWLLFLIFRRSAASFGWLSVGAVFGAMALSGGLKGYYHAPEVTGINWPELALLGAGGAGTWIGYRLARLLPGASWRDEQR